MLTLGLPTTDHVPPVRVTALARFATVANAQAVARMPLERRTATLLAFVRTLEATAQDDVLDLFDIVVTALFTNAAKIGKKARLRTLRDLDAAALQLRVVLEQQTELKPTEIMSDTGAYTDTIFGIFHLLGYQFSPCLADLGGTRFWRVDGKAD